MPFVRTQTDGPAPVSFLVPQPAFPSSITSADIVAWMNGDLQAYSDIAGTAAQDTLGGVVGRINEASPLSGNWQASSTGQRGQRLSNGIRSDYAGTSLPGVQYVRLAAASIPLNNATLAISYCELDGYGGPNSGLAATFPALLGAVGGGGLLRGFINGSATDTGLVIPRGRRVDAVMSWTPTALKVQAIIGGTVQSPVSIAATLSGGSTGGSGIAAFNASASAQGFYGFMNQQLWMNRACSDVEAMQLATWMASRPMTTGYPTSAPLVAVVGDSIARGAAGVTANDSWIWVMLQNQRAGVAPTLEVCNVAIGGSGVAGSALPSTGQFAAAPFGQYTVANGFYSSSRAKNIMVVAIGTNDLANGNSAAATLAGIYAVADAAKAAGWLVVIATILPRSDTMTVSQGTFNTARATVNADIVANYASHGNALANVAAVSGMGADGDSNGGNYNADHIHPVGGGHRLIEPTYRAAVASLL